jgi:hypothetical protein
MGKVAALVLGLTALALVALAVVYVVGLAVRGAEALWRRRPNTNKEDN